MKAVSPIEKHLYGTQAWAIAIGGKWFGGFTDKRKLPEGAPDVKLRDGMCDARLIHGDQKADGYMRRLRERGHSPKLVLVAAIFTPDERDDFLAAAPKGEGT